MLEESIRWLMTNGKVEEAKKILRKATNWNKVEYGKVENLPYFAEANMEKSNSIDTELDSIENTDDDATKNEKAKHHRVHAKKYNALDILRNPALRVNTFILWYAW
jgi:hypothetical protein